MSSGRRSNAGLSLEFQKIIDLTKKHVVDKVPFPERHWTREKHAMMTAKSRERVETVLLCAHRLRITGSELSLPVEMWYKILEHPHWDKTFVTRLPPEILSVVGNFVTKKSIEELTMFLVAELGIGINF